MGFNRYLSLLVFVCITALHQPVFAAKAPGGFSEKELNAIKPMLRRHGLVGLSETDAKGNPTSMTLAIRVKAPREIAFKTIEDPKNYYYLSTLLKENNIIQEHENAKAWSWASRHKLFSFTGINTIALFPPRRADVAFTKSNIGSGSFTFNFYEDGKDHTIVVLSGILDVESSEWLICFLVGGNPAMREAMNVAIGAMLIKGMKSLAEKMARGKKLAKHRTRGKAGGTMRIVSSSDLKRLAPLLVRGQVIITDSRSGGRLRQATVIDVVNAPAQKILDAISTPKNYQKMIKAISEVVVHDATDTEIDFSWTLGFSVFGITSRNRMTSIDQGVLLEGLEGDLKGAKWRWQIVPVEDNKAVVAYHGFAHIGKSAYILQKTINREPYLEHGLMIGTNMVMLGAIRRATE